MRENVATGSENSGDSKPITLSKMSANEPEGFKKDHLSSQPSVENLRLQPPAQRG